MPRAEDEPAKDASEDESEASSSNGDQHAVPDLMVITRERRANAGNRMAKLLAVEENDELGKSLYEALQDVPDDDDFGGAEADAPDDISLESSDADADEDPGPPPEDGAEDLEGERELEKQERAARRALKRKAQGAMFKLPAVRKRPKLASSVAGESTPGSSTAPLAATTTPTTAPRPRKRVERVSWLPSKETGPVRLSSRTSALKNRAETHERLREKEKSRLITVANMRAAEERNRDKDARRPMTQAERLAEAAEVERINSQSLNSWEEAERKRAAEQKARLEALKNRKLEGPVIRYWSGPAIWLDNKLAHVGKKWKVEEVREQVTAERQIQEPQGIAPGLSEQESSANVSVTASNTHQTPEDSAVQESFSQPPPPPPAISDAASTYPNPIVFAPPQLADTFTAIPENTMPDQKPAQAPLQPIGNPPPLPPPPPPKPVVEAAARNVIILQNFDPAKVRDKEFQRRVLIDCPSTKPTSKSLYLFASRNLRLSNSDLSG